MKRKFAFVLMGAEYTPSVHQALFETAGMDTLIRTARDYAEAKDTVLKLAGEDVGAIELCGAFGKARAQELERLTEGKVAIGYIVNEPSMAQAAKRFFDA